MLSDHLGLKHTPDTVLADPLILHTFTEPCQLLAHDPELNRRP